MPNPETKPFKTTIRWGGLVAKEERPVETYAFATSEELAAFMYGVGETDGWTDYEEADADGNFVDDEPVPPPPLGSEDRFHAKYTGDPAYRSTATDTNGVMETFTPEIDRVLLQNEANPKKVWTIIETEKGMNIAAGYHVVDRFM